MASIGILREHAAQEDVENVERVRIACEGFEGRREPVGRCLRGRLDVCVGLELEREDILEGKALAVPLGQ
jgi:hypothetical protein